MGHDPLPQPKAGLEFGDWVLLRPVGRGGNGQVWQARRAGGETGGALKLLTKVKPVAYARFRNEVRVMESVRLRGIVPILDSHLPGDPTKERAWYAMPLGRPLLEHLREASLTEVVESVLSLAQTLSQLHERGISHRDIKPANLLWIGGRPMLADFGLVNYPDKEDLTGRREQLGPRWTMAPEVRRLGKDADPLVADVYALAKSLWMLSSQDEEGFDGQYNPDTSVSISAMAGDAFLEPLETLLVDATDHEPDARPTMLEFANRLAEWLRIQGAFRERNTLEWAELQRSVFPFAAPSRAIWTALDEIVLILNLIGQRSNMNHLFFPSGGGMDLDGATRSLRESDCIELDTGAPALVRPERLLFENLGKDPQWNYFRLETAELEPSGVYSNEGAAYEEVVDLGGGRYVDRVHWDYGEYQGQRLPEEAQLVVRHLSGAFVVFQKASHYNRDRLTYDARHNGMNADQFREYVQRNMDRLRQRAEGDQTGR